MKTKLVLAIGLVIGLIAGPAVGETVTFDASTSSDPDGNIELYSWDFGDGDTGTGVTATHVYTVKGTYVVTLTITDNDELTDTATRFITIGKLSSFMHAYSV